MTFEWSIIQNSTQSYQSIVKHEAKFVLNQNIWRSQGIEREGFYAHLSEVGGMLHVWSDVRFNVAYLAEIYIQICQRILLLPSY
jgi:hypothetical protein